MTTIACDGKSMAADGQAQAGGAICCRSMVKVFALSDGSLYGACGDSGDGERHMKWVDEGCEGAPPEKLDTDFGFLCLRPTGRLFEGGSSALLTEIEAPFAVGSGGEIALGAMDAGATAEQAVAIAASRNPHTGGKVTCLRLEPALRAVE